MNRHPDDYPQVIVESTRDDVLPVVARQPEIVLSRYRALYEA